VNNSSNPSVAGPLSLRSAKVFVTSPGRNYVLLRLETTSGVVGWGEATLNGRELAVAQLLEQHLLPLLMSQGSDATRIEWLWQYIYRSAYWSSGAEAMAALAAIDLALWDLNAKALGVPLFRMFGGSVRDGISVYRHAQGATIDDTLAAGDRLRCQGVTALRIQVAASPSATSYGVAAAGSAYEPAQRGLPHTEVFSVEPYIRSTVELFRRARSHFGPDVALLHDCHHRLNASQTVRLCRALEPYNPFWIEDPLRLELVDKLVWVRQQTCVPIATGEVISNVFDGAKLVNQGAIDHLRAAPGHVGGISPLRKLAGIAEMQGICVSPHGPSDLGPIAFAAALHMDLAIQNLGLQEWMGFPETSKEVFDFDWRFESGRLHPGERPGLGVGINEEALGKFPYQAAWLPVAALPDGTVHPW
jgi:mannonate dehydratase